jgi:hypothetical protein
MRCRVAAGALLACSCALIHAKQRPRTDDLPSAESVMARVGENQDRAEAERARYIYVQHAKMVSRRGNTLMCEEITDYRMTPSTHGLHEQLLKLDGRQLSKHQYVAYQALPPQPAPLEPPQSDTPKQETSAAEAKDVPGDSEKKDEGRHDTLRVTVNDDNMDRDLVENLRWNLIHDKSKDGIAAHLFPLTSKEQAGYTFRMIGRERLNEHDVFHIAFRPRKKEDFGWSGDALIDTAAYQPVLITTAMSRKIPFAVRTLLGTNLPGLGFTVTYAPQADGVWFPVSFSTEFKIHVLFFFHREIILDAQNRSFEKTHVTSRILDVNTVAQDPPL